MSVFVLCGWPNVLCALHYTPVLYFFRCSFFFFFFSLNIILLLLLLFSLNSHIIHICIWYKKGDRRYGISMPMVFLYRHFLYLFLLRCPYANFKIMICFTSLKWFCILYCVRVCLFFFFFPFRRSVFCCFFFVIFAHFVCEVCFYADLPTTMFCMCVCVCRLSSFFPTCFISFLLAVTACVFDLFHIIIRIYRTNVRFWFAQVNKKKLYYKCTIGLWVCLYSPQIYLSIERVTSLFNIV